jgi:hypothetical protein
LTIHFLSYSHITRYGLDAIGALYADAGGAVAFRVVCSHDDAVVAVDGNVSFLREEEA